MEQLARAKESKRRLVDVQVEQLLGRFDHRVEFPAEQDFVILHGPNGIGKTKLLELINATFSGDMQKVAEIPFRAAYFKFDDENQIIIERPGQEALPGLGEDESSGISFNMLLKQPGGRVIPWSPPEAISPKDFPSSFLRAMERELPLRRVGPSSWRDMAERDVLSTAQAYLRYRDYLPRIEIPGMDEMPDEMKEVISSISVHLIETQRLIDSDVYDPARRVREGERVRRPTVLEFSADFSRRLGEAMEENSEVSQKLDREFPRKILVSETSPSPEITEKAIRDRYSRQSETREKLTQIAVLDTSGELPLPPRSLKDWEMRVLWTYLDNTEIKLDTFRSLLDRVELLREIVNSRFLYKELRLDRSGFRITTSGGREIGANRLSSGEQHELVMAYDLLFNVEPNSLVLIDEPEISLHVAWQKQFLSDIVRIAAITSSRFMVATHSPQIIHKYWSQTVGLEPGYGEFGRERL
ncbi:AAA family ATPase [Streptomyces zhihengii]|uniref:AAA family ATPase n=1 Tax=Streptomyces zhihengii TaxID=1818004 RepID=UPI0034521A85